MQKLKNHLPALAHGALFGFLGSVIGVGIAAATGTGALAAVVIGSVIGLGAVGAVVMVNAALEPAGALVGAFLSALTKSPPPKTSRYHGLTAVAGCAATVAACVTLASSVGLIKGWAAKNFNAASRPGPAITQPAAPTNTVAPPGP